MEDLSPDKLAAVYIKIRNAVAEKEDEVKTLKEKQSIIADKMLELCSTLNTNSLQTPEGTITRTVRSNYWTSDWDAMYTFIENNNAPFLLEKRIHTKNMKDFLTDHPDAHPAGLQSNNKYTISVRKPKPSSI
tara:strand:+ start:451 stop:846 length:396 start_codon:yes stop_codon:yes gene_type:complete